MSAPAFAGDTTAGWGFPGAVVLVLLLLALALVERPRRATALAARVLPAPFLGGEPPRGRVRIDPAAIPRLVQALAETHTVLLVGDLPAPPAASSPVLRLSDDAPRALAAAVAARAGERLVVLVRADPDDIAAWVAAAAALPAHVPCLVLDPAADTPLALVETGGTWRIEPT